MVMTDKIIESKKKERLHLSFQTGKPIFKDPTYKLREYNLMLSEHDKYCLYLELLANGLCSDLTLSIQTNISVKEISKLNKVLSDQVLSFEYFVCNENGCNVFAFYTLNKDLFYEYKDIDNLDF